MKKKKEANAFYEDMSFLSFGVSASFVIVLCAI